MAGDENKTLKERLLEQKRQDDLAAAQAKADAAHADRQAKTDLLWEGKGITKENQHKHGPSVDQITKSLTEVDASSYTEWSTVMMKLLNGALVLNNAIFETYSAPEIVERAINYLARTPGSAPQAVLQSIWVKGSGLVMSKLGSPKSPDVTFSANLNEKGELDVKATSDGKEFSKVAMELFKPGVVRWARLQGYSHENNKFKDNTGREMTADEFNDLSMDPDNGLQAFVEGHFDMEMKNSSSPQP